MPERLSATLDPRPSEPQGQRNALRALGLAVLIAAGACDRHEPVAERTPATPLPLRVFADSAIAIRLAVPPPAVARAWLARVSRLPPVPIAAPRPLETVPEAAPAEPPAAAWEPESLEIDEGLKPPIPKEPARVRPPAARGGGSRVDLDVRIDEAGEVTDAMWAGGSADSSDVRAAIDCALGMHFHPALQGGRPVAVWCRQRFAFERGRALRLEASGDAGE